MSETRTGVITREQYFEVLRQQESSLLERMKQLDQIEDAGADEALESVEKNIALLQYAISDLQEQDFDEVNVTIEETGHASFEIVEKNND